MDNLELDPVVLETTATVIELYCSKQKSIIDSYLSNASSLTSEWTDDQTIGPLLDEIRRINSSLTEVMDEVRATYPKYFRDKAEQIRNRPKM